MVLTLDFKKTCVAMALCQLFSQPSQAATVTVNSLVDPGVEDDLCTLREAILSVNANATNASGCNSSGGGDIDTVDFGSLGSAATIILTDGEIPITTTVTINGPGADDLTIDANNASRILNIDDSDNGSNFDVVLSGLTCTGGNTGDGDNYYGGAIRSLENLSISDTVITGNTAGDSGGGVFVRHYTVGGSFSLNNVSLTNNNADPQMNHYGRGGGLFFRSDMDGVAIDASVTINQSVISNNQTQREGGGFFLRVSASNGASSTVTVSNSVISSNISLTDDGGGAYIESRAADGSSATVLLQNLQVLDNLVNDNEGGGLNLRQLSLNAESWASLTLANSTISGNSANIEGGGVYVNSIVSDGGFNSVTLNSLKVTKNVGAEGGGGLYVRNDLDDDPTSIATFTLLNSSISGNSTQNSSEGLGGGAYFAGDGEFLVESSTFSDNFSAEGGGGFYLKLRDDGDHQGLFELVNSTVSGNRSDGDGGGVRTNSPTGYEDTSFIITNSTITGNTADANNDAGVGQSGGGIALNDIASVTLINSIVAGNIDQSGIATDVYINPTASFSASYSLIGDNLGSGLIEAPTNMPDASGNFIGGVTNGVINPRFVPLDDNGGDTRTHALRSGSPAIDTANLADCPTLDQIGLTRDDGDSLCNMGSVELFEDETCFVVPTSNGKVAVFCL